MPYKMAAFTSTIANQNWLEWFYWQIIKRFETKSVKLKYLRLNWHRHNKFTIYFLIIIPAPRSRYRRIYGIEQGISRFLVKISCQCGGQRTMYSSSLPFASASCETMSNWKGENELKQEATDKLKHRKTRGNSDIFWYCFIWNQLNSKVQVVLFHIILGNCVG